MTESITIQIGDTFFPSYAFIVRLTRRTNTRRHCLEQDSVPVHGAGVVGYVLSTRLFRWFDGGNQRDILIIINAILYYNVLLSIVINYCGIIV